MARNKLNLPDYLPYLVNRVGAALVARFTADALGQHGLTIAMWRVLAALSDNGAQRQVDLAGLTSIDVSTLSRLVSRLIAMGLVTRLRSAKSSREVVVRLTAPGETLVARLIPVARALEKRAIAGLPKGELAAAKAALRRIYANLEGGEKKSGADAFFHRSHSTKRPLPPAAARAFGAHSPQRHAANRDPKAPGPLRNKIVLAT